MSIQLPLYSGGVILYISFTGTTLAEQSQGESHFYDDIVTLTAEYITQPIHFQLRPYLP